MKKIFKRFSVMCLVFIGLLAWTTSVNANGDTNTQQDLKPEVTVNVANEKTVYVTWSVNDQNSQIKEFYVYYKNLQAEIDPNEEGSENETVEYGPVEANGASEYTVELSGLEQNRQHEFYVKAVLNDDTTIVSESEIVMTKGIYLSAENIGGEVSLAWDYNSDSGAVKSYNIWKAEENEETGELEWTLAKTINGDAETIYTFRDLESNTDYWFYVEAVLQDDSKIKSATVDVSTAEGIRADLTPISGTEVYLSWNWDKGYYGDFTSFKVYKLVSGDEGTSEELVGTTKNNYYIVRDLTKRTICHFKIVGINKYGEEVVGETGILKTPSFGLKAITTSATSVDLTWDYDGSDGVATKYNIYRSMTDEERLVQTGTTCDDDDEDCDESDEILVGTVNSDKKSYTINNLKQGQSYNFIVQAVLEDENHKVSSNYVLSVLNSSIPDLENKTYNGQKQTQNFVVSYNINNGNVRTQNLTSSSSKTMSLENNKDYEITYQNNINAGTAKVIIKGKGIFAGQIEKTFTINPLNITKTSVSKIADRTYNGKAQNPNFYVTYGKNSLKAKKDFNITYKNNTNAGTATITIKGIGNYTGSKNITFKINKANNPLVVKAKNKKVKYKKVKKKKQNITAITVTKSQGKVTYAKVSGSKKITINKYTGKITIKKKTKKGTYKIKLKVTAAGNKNYKAGNKIVTLTIKVK